MNVRRKLTRKSSDSEGWEVPSVVRRSEVRAHLAAIVRHVSKGERVMVGMSSERAYSAFITEREFQRQHASKLPEPRDVDVEELRRLWSAEREQVENTGKPLRINRKGEVSAFLVPTKRALEIKVASTRKVMEGCGIGAIEEMNERLARVESLVLDIQAKMLPDEELRKLRGLCDEMFRAWRASNGLPVQAG